LSGINPANVTLLKIFIIASQVISFTGRQGHPYFGYEVAGTILEPISEIVH